MKNLSLLVVTIFLCANSSNVFGEQVTAGPRITLDPNVALPVGGLSDGAGFGFGASAAIRLPVHPQVGLSGRAGFLFHVPKNDITTIALPLYAGASYSFKPAVTTPYLAAELGLVHLRLSGDGLPESTSQTALGGTLGGGYRLALADLRVGLQVYDFGELSDSLSLFASLAFRTAKF